MRLVVTGGGTGGHVYPALAIAQACAGVPAFAPLVTTYVGSRRGLEARLVAEAGVPMAFVRAAPLERGRPLALVRTVLTNAAGFVEALVAMRRARPDVLVATGGYVTFPVVAALRTMRALGVSRARIALLEPNARAGLANRMLAPLVDEIWYAATPGRPLLERESVVGTPVRGSLRHLPSRASARAAFAFDEARPVVVVMGGSQGARTLNEALADLVRCDALPEVQFLAIAGTRDYDALRVRIAGRGGVTVVPYVDDPALAYAAADVVVARAGASTLGELAATATPALLVPYPHATDDHQAHNARAFAATGAARVVDDRDLDGPRLGAELAAMLAPERLAAMRAAAGERVPPDATERIVARMKAALGQEPSARGR